jgi:hypothetical protein
MCDVQSERFELEYGVKNHRNWQTCLRNSSQVSDAVCMSRIGTFILCWADNTL